MGRNLTISLALIAAVLVALTAAARGSGDDAPESGGKLVEGTFADLVEMIDEALAS